MSLCSLYLFQVMFEQWRYVKQNCAWLQEEEALLKEMDVTGQAFEDMQEQNSRLIQQLREKEWR